MSGPQPGQTNSKLPALSEETIKQLIVQQGHEAQLRGTELQIRKQELEYQSKHATDILGAQERDRENERKHDRKKEHAKLIFAAFCVIVLVSLIALGMYLGKDALVNDILKVFGGLVAGALGGYGYSKVETKKKEEAESD